MESRKKRRKSKKPPILKLADKLTEVLIYFIIIFSPWAFGTSEVWSTWTMNISAYLLGLILVTKYLIGDNPIYNPWQKKSFKIENIKQKRLKLTHKTCNIILFSSIILLLIYIMISAINARALFDFETKEYVYFTEFKEFLPHSYNAKATWFVFWQYLGLTIFFVATKNWLDGANKDSQQILINKRLKKLLIIICLNGGLLAFQSITQRFYFDNYGKLLFFVEPTINKANILQFGPFAYRSNACSYFNLIWPISIALFTELIRENQLHKKIRFGKSSEVILIPASILMLSCPIISSARGGALVMLGLTLLIIGTIIFKKPELKFIHSTILASLATSLAIAFYFGWSEIEPRLVSMFSGNFSNRIQIYEATIGMIRDYGFFGSGPGSFEAVIQFEMGDKFPNWEESWAQSWESWAHNDYLEFYLTFGKIGTILIGTIIIIFIFKIIMNIIYERISSLYQFGLIALTGLAIHAAFDFPLQTHSILIIVSAYFAILSHNQKTFCQM